MYCKNCGYENDDDASFCERCGANLGSATPPQSRNGMSTTNKVLIVVVIILILGIGIAVAMLLTSNAPVANNTSKNTSVVVTDTETTSDTSTDDNTPILIDSGSMSGTDAKYDDGPFTYEWKTYQIDDENLVMYGTYVAGSKTVKQTVTLKKFDDERVEITVEPKSSGKSSWYTVTTSQGYSNVLDYYWKIFRQNREEAGPVS
ncbi:MAG: hypothetical protein A4E25_01902 [Methanobacterium sp. PtaB.Bin024]|nr:MAG: hypothetical protein A4E25_01902 [Methanobacterium sp. PtaB.Bin024]